MRQETAPAAAAETADAENRIAFQGEQGAFSHQACSEVFPDMLPVPCPTFEEAIATVRRGEARLAMLPVENSLYGRVADIHHLLPESGLYVIGEYFLPIRMQLLGLPEATLTLRIIRPGSWSALAKKSRRSRALPPLPALYSGSKTCQPLFIRRWVVLRLMA